MTWFPGKRSVDRRLRRVLLGVLALALVAAGTAAALTTRAAVAPTNASLPTTSGTNTVGSTLTANAGTWNGSTPITFAYVWQICGANGELCHDIAGATSQTYTLKADDAGNTVRVRVTGTNADGSASAISAPSARIATTGSGPANTAPPTISGSTATGSTLTAANGTWNGAAPITYAYQWTVCDNTGGACHDIAGATTNKYVLKDTDAGNTMRARVTATNAAGSNSATSTATAVVGAPAAGCPTPAAGTTVPVDSVTSPARLQVAQYLITTGKLTLETTTFSIQFLITDTCARPVSGALVYPTAVPYNQFTIPKEGITDATGHVTLTFNRLKGYPAADKQQQLTMFVRARKASDPILAGISTRRLIAFAIKK